MVKVPSTQDTQADRFRAIAKELGADDDEATFKAKLAAIARAKPKDGSVEECNEEPAK